MGRGRRGCLWLQGDALYLWSIPDCNGDEKADEEMKAEDDKVQHCLPSRSVTTALPYSYMSQGASQTLFKCKQEAMGPGPVAPYDRTLQVQCIRNRLCQG